MNAKRVPVQPMAIPFRVEQFLFRRQIQLEKEVTESRLYQKIELFASRARMEAALAGFVTGRCFLPGGFLPVVDEAVQRFKTVARLPYEIHVALAPATEVTTNAIGIIKDRHMTILLGSGIVQNCSADELVFHLAAATFQALHRTPRHVSILLEEQAPFALEERLKAMELLRLMSYAVDCFALVCCGRLDTVLREGFYWATGVRVPRTGTDFRRLAEHSLEGGQYGDERLLNEGRWRLDYPPLTPLVLAQFQESEVYRACRGEGGGVPREQFEAAVLEMERVAHRPMAELPEEQLQFAGLACLLATRFLMEAAGTITKERQAAFLKFFNCESSGAADVAGHVNQQHGEESNLREDLERLLAGPNAKWGNLHGVRIIESALEFAAQEHGGAIPDEVQSALLELGRWLHFDKQEVTAIYVSIMDSLLERPKTGE